MRKMNEYGKGVEGGYDQNEHSMNGDNRKKSKQPPKTTTSQTVRVKVRKHNLIPGCGVCRECEAMTRAWL